MSAKDLRKLLRELEHRGSTVTVTANGHYLARNPEGKAVTTISGTPSDPRAWKNALAYLRQAGFVWPPA